MRPARVLFLLLFSNGLAAQDTPPAGWTATAAMAEARHSSCAVRMRDGRILITGGTGVAGDLASSEIYLAEGAFLPGPRMTTTRSQHSCTLLNDGRVLVAGGDAEATGSAEVFDPQSGEWQFVAGTGEARRGHTATLLADGRVLLAGGDAGEGPLDSIAIFDPLELSLTSSDPALWEARSQHAAVLLADGRVLIAGGKGANGILASTEIFDLRDFSVETGPDLSTPRAGHSVIHLDDGRILAAGGFDGTRDTDTAEMLDATATGWALLGARLSTARRDHLAILIPGNGGVLIAGGLRNGQPLAATELFLPVENNFLPLGPLTLGRSGMAVAAVDAGMILAAGGRNADGPQSACGVLLVPAIQFSKSLYHIPETALLTGTFFPANTTATFSLTFLNGTTVIAGNSRLLTASTSSASSKVSFSAVPILLTAGTDGGLTARVVAATPNGITAVASTLIRNATSLTLSLPAPFFEGLNTTLLAQLQRSSSSKPMTGNVTMNVTVNTGGVTTTITDGSSNTIQIGESGPTPINTTSSTVFVQKSLTNPAPATRTVSATYSGDAANDPASATGTFTVVSKTPVVQLSSSVANPQAGVPFNLTASVRPATAVTPAHAFNGTLNFLQSGFLLGSGSGLSLGGQPDFFLTFTPLTLNQLTFSATYSGDTFFRNATSNSLILAVQKAPTTLTIDSAPSSYACGQPSTFNVTLAYPSPLGLTNHSVGLQTIGVDGSVRGVGTIGSTGPGLVVIPPGLKDLQAKAATSLTATLPLDIASVSATFSGDSLLNAATSAAVPVTAQLGTTSVALTNVPATLTNPATLTAQVTSTSCSIQPTGSLEFLDGTASLAVVPMGVTLLPFGAAPSNGPSTNTGALSVSRPPGTRSLSVRYSGDRHYLPSTSAPVSVVFQ